MLRVVLLLLVCISPTSFALSKLGHQLVCQLSFDKLSNIQQKNIQAMLNSIPAKELKRINKYNHRPKNEKITFAKACTWPDAIKHSKKYKAYKNWHYLNIPRNTQVISAKNIHNNCNQQCITHAITFHAKKFQRENNAWEKLQALMFLGHWLGDIHQPLHISFASDLGGNKSKIKTQIKCNNLHWYWDECLLTSDTKDYKKQLATLFTLWANSPIEKWQESSLVEWANESFELVKQPDFLYCQPQKNRCERIKYPVTLTEEYRKKYLPILRTQLVKASARLNTFLINDL